MRTSILRSRTGLSHSRLVGLCIAALLVFAVLFGTVLTPGAQAAVSYGDQEIAFVNLLNNYRVANGLSPLLVSDMISEACDRHNSDMAKYKFFSHYSVKSDWFATNASPWDRMAASGYNYNTSKGENIAAGQSTAAEVFAAWKASRGPQRQHVEFRLQGHRSQLLPTRRVSLHLLLDDRLRRIHRSDRSCRQCAAASDQHALPADRSPLRLQRHLGDVLDRGGLWGKLQRANTGSASVTVTFTGTYLAWIATAGTTLSKAYVSLDGGAAQSVDLARSAVAYQQKVWTTGTLPSGKHTVKIWRNPSDAAGKYISVDAVDVTGTLN